MHGGRYRKEAHQLDLDYRKITDYSTSINWSAIPFHPDTNLFNPEEVSEYPDPAYHELKTKISRTFNIAENHFTLTNGANDAISYFYHFILLSNSFPHKKFAFIGPTYYEYEKYCTLNNFEYQYYSYDSIDLNPEMFIDKIIILVNPNTPWGIFKNIDTLMPKLVENNTPVLIDESFIDFTTHQSAWEKYKNYENLFVIRSLTKFFGSPGSRLGIIINSSKQNIEILNKWIPPWSISTFDNWFYIHIIDQYPEIKETTLNWIETEQDKLNQIINQSKNISLLKPTETNYSTLLIDNNYLNDYHIKDFKLYCMQKYSIYVRPTNTFYECPYNSFRIGLRTTAKNQALFDALEYIG